MRKKRTCILLLSLSLLSTSFIGSQGEAEAKKYSSKKNYYHYYTLKKPNVTTNTSTQTSTNATTTNVPSAPTQTTTNVTAEEKEMVELINAERKKQGLQPLTINNEMTKVARLKVKDMIDNNYFSHQSPTYGSPFDMLKKYGISYRTAGENIAGNQTVQKAHTSLMNSTGHRANILNSQYTEVGIGIVNGGPYGKMFVQLFKG